MDRSFCKNHGAMQMENHLENFTLFSSVLKHLPFVSFYLPSDIYVHVAMNEMVQNQPNHLLCNSTQTTHFNSMNSLYSSLLSLRMERARMKKEMKHIYVYNIKIRSTSAVLHNTGISRGKPFKDDCMCVRFFLFQKNK